MQILAIFKLKEALYKELSNGKTTRVHMLLLISPGMMFVNFVTIAHGFFAKECSAKFRAANGFNYSITHSLLYYFPRNEIFL